jgi:hypothetical protein
MRSVVLAESISYARWSELSEPGASLQLSRGREAARARLFAPYSRTSSVTRGSSPTCRTIRRRRSSCSARSARSASSRYIRPQDGRACRTRWPWRFPPQRRRPSAGRIEQRKPRPTTAGHLTRVGIAAEAVMSRTQSPARPVGWCGITRREVRRSSRRHRLASRCCPQALVLAERVRCAVGRLVERSEPFVEFEADHRVLPCPVGLLDPVKLGVVEE